VYLLAVAMLRWRCEVLVCQDLVQTDFAGAACRQLVEHEQLLLTQAVLLHWRIEAAVRNSTDEVRCLREQLWWQSADGPTETLRSNGTDAGTNFHVSLSQEPASCKWATEKLVRWQHAAFLLVSRAGVHRAQCALAAWSAAVRAAVRLRALERLRSAGHALQAAKQVATTLTWPRLQPLLFATLLAWREAVHNRQLHHPKKCRLSHFSERSLHVAEAILCSREYIILACLAMSAWVRETGNAAGKGVVVQSQKIPLEVVRAGVAKCAAAWIVGIEGTTLRACISAWKGGILATRYSCSIRSLDRLEQQQSSVHGQILEITSTILGRHHEACALAIVLMAWYKAGFWLRFEHAQSSFEMRCQNLRTSLCKRAELCIRLGLLLWISLLSCAVIAAWKDEVNSQKLSGACTHIRREIGRTTKYRVLNLVATFNMSCQHVHLRALFATWRLVFRLHASALLFSASHHLHKEGCPENNRIPSCMANT